MTPKKVLIIDGNPRRRALKFLNFTNIATNVLPNFTDHVRDLIHIIKTEYKSPQTEMVFCQVIENYDGTDNYQWDPVNHANFNKALIWAIEQGFTHVYVSFYFATAADNMLCYNTERLTKKLKIYCASENTPEEHNDFKGNNYCPSKEQAVYVSSDSNQWSGTTPYGEDYTSRLALRAMLDS